VGGGTKKREENDKIGRKIQTWERNLRKGGDGLHYKGKRHRWWKIDPYNRGQWL
jgi:hypothetical protein